MTLPLFRNKNAKPLNDIINTVHRSPWSTSINRKRALQIITEWQHSDSDVIVALDPEHDGIAH